MTPYRKGLLRRLPILLIFVLARRPALLKLPLERSERFISRAANGAHQIDTVLYERVEKLMAQPELQLHIGGRVRKPEEFLGRLPATTLWDIIVRL